ncbi:peptide antibiotic transporter SbmA [Roseibium sp. MMSF_3412]|uniref:peptide antibiotic transporter SbmA n=1 Tax=Roseibium sp. MMSF_3412 TaxID=3046712 RepID=UPI00273E6B89|nr:peptide antibiotic transporter SbmA [Roseibium sp. MMSF_3412]
MFRSFFKNRKWFLWAWIGSVLILWVTWYKVQQSVKINEWYGTFFDMIQRALQTPGSVTSEEYWQGILAFLEVAIPLITVAVLLEFFIRHYVFRWRTAMNDYYMSHWHVVRHIEGAAQRVQEDTMRFARIMESLGVSFMRSIMTLVAFLPILWELSQHVTELPIVGQVEGALVFAALLSAAFGTVLLALVGIKLPGLEFNNQKVEAAYRKELVYGEDHDDRASPATITSLFSDVRKNYFKLYFHYLYFDVAKWVYLQGAVLIPLIVLAPTILAGAITYGLLQRISSAFNQVENSFQFLVNSWGTIIELMSIYKRLRAFEQHIRQYENEGGEPIPLPAE